MADKNPTRRHPTFKNIIGKKFNRLTAIEYSHYKNGHSFWLCRCDCGNTRILPMNALRSGNTKSCGCLYEEIRPQINYRHGHAAKREYFIWWNMKSRCENPDDPGFKNYGNRGIVVCERWQSLDNFISDMGRCPPRHTIERKNVNGDYSPENCRWATQQEQQRNKRNTRLITYRGQTKSLGQWAEELKIKHNVLWNRLFLYHWPVEHAFIP